MNEALRAFTRENAGAHLALVFYAGHGLEMDGVNYLVPVDARLERVVILDACRDETLVAYAAVPECGNRGGGCLVGGRCGGTTQFMPHPRKL